MFALILAALAAQTPAPPSIEGRWKSPGGNSIIEIAACGTSTCGTVAWASARAKEDSRKVTDQLVGTQLLTGLAQDSKGRWHGKLFVPDKNVRVTAKLQMVGDQLRVSGCAAGRALCKSTLWTRVDGPLQHPTSGRRSSPSKLNGRFLPQIKPIAPRMTRIFAKIALIALAAAVPVTASAQAALEGHWKNPKGSVVVRVASCGDAYCGVVVQASDKAKASARKGGTPTLIGTRILSGMKPTGDGTFKGLAFDPKRNIRAPATVRLLGPSTLVVKGCVLSGIICKEQRWTRVS